MTTLTLACEGDDAHAVFREALSNLSLTDESTVTVTISFGSFSISAEGETVEEVARNFSALEYNQSPTSIELSAQVGGLPAVESATEADAESGGEDSSSGTRETHTSTPARLAADTMEHVVSQLIVEYLADGSAESAFDVVGIGFKSREVYESESMLDLTFSQVTNTLGRLSNKGLVDRERAVEMDGFESQGGGYVYFLNRAGAAEVERLGEPDYEESPAVLTDDERGE